ncbi:ribonuclease H-like domain-containing protein [Tanacetum coccineum]
MKYSFKTLNTARQSSSRAAISVNTTYTRLIVNSARPTSNVFNRAHSHVRRPFNTYTTNKNNNFNEKVNNVRENITTVGPKAVVNDNKGNEANTVKASASWVWRPKQMCDKKNNVLFTDTECVVLSPDFKFNLFSVSQMCIENLIELRVKVIRCVNRTEFKNRVMNQFCEMKGIKREFSVARTPQQNGVAERKNRILIEAARTMLADSKLPTTFWDEAVNTTCYVQYRVLVIKPHNKTPYELFLDRKPALNFMRPFMLQSLIP